MRGMGIVLFGSAVLMGCSNSPGANDAGADATSDVTLDAIDDAPPGDAGSDVHYTGAVCFDQGASSYEVRAAFWPGFSGNGAFGCTFSSGNVPGGDAGFASALCQHGTPNVSAGTVTLTDGTSTLAALTPNGTTYAAVTNPPTTSLAWDGGDLIQVVSSGDTVHALAGSFRTAPPFANVAPALSDSSSVTVPRSSDLTITWTPSSVPGTVVAAIVVGANGHIVCAGDDTKGKVTVPTAQLQSFAAGGGTVTLVRFNEGEATSDNGGVDLLSTAIPYGGNVTFN